MGETSGNRPQNLSGYNKRQSLACFLTTTLLFLYTPWEVRYFMQRRAPSPTTGLHGSHHPARATYDAKTLASQDAFLLAFPRSRSIAEAASAAQVSDQSVYDWREDNILGFSARFARAQLQRADYLEELAQKRVENPSFNGRIGSDVLLMGMLNANSDKWRRNVIVTHELGARVVETLRELQARDREAGTGDWQPELPAGRVVEGERADGDEK